jgi:hypothetical protein
MCQCTGLRRTYQCTNSFGIKKMSFNLVLVLTLLGSRSGSCSLLFLFLFFCKNRCIIIFLGQGNALYRCSCHLCNSLIFHQCYACFFNIKTSFLKNLEDATNPQCLLPLLEDVLICRKPKPGQRFVSLLISAIGELT